MAQEHSLYIPRFSDRHLIDAFEFLNAEYNKSHFSATAASGVTFNRLPTESSTNDLSEQWNLLFELKTTLLISANFQIEGFNIVFYRGTRETPKSAIYDELYFSISQNGNVPPNLDRLKIIGHLAQRLKAFDPNRSIVSTAGKESKNLAALHESMLSRLEQLGTDLIRETSQTRNELEKEFYKKRLAGEEEVTQLKSTLLESHEVERLELQEERRKLEEIQRRIDDRSNTHARRELRNRMLEDVKERIGSFGVSEKTAGKRRPIFIAFFMLMLALAILLTVSVYELDRIIQVAAASKIDIATISSSQNSAVKDPIIHTTASEIFYFAWFRVAALTLGFVFSLIYFVRWQNKWAEQHAAAEFNLQQFYVDVNRANWVIESGLEWRKETDAEMPQEILSSVTRNLFKNSDESTATIHPADELASALLGSASKLKLRAGDNELEFDKPGKIKAEVQSKNE